ncbi:MAG: hypothetical protein WDW38_001987 [Sanguina aurantia]
MAGAGSKAMPPQPHTAPRRPTPGDRPAAMTHPMSHRPGAAPQPQPDTTHPTTHHPHGEELAQPLQSDTTHPTPPRPDVALRVPRGMTRRMTHHHHAEANHHPEPDTTPRTLPHPDATPLQLQLGKNPLTHPRPGAAVLCQTNLPSLNINNNDNGTTHVTHHHHAGRPAEVQPGMTHRMTHLRPADGTQLPPQPDTTPQTHHRPAVSDQLQPLHVMTQRATHHRPKRRQAANARHDSPDDSSPPRRQGGAAAAATAAAGAAAGAGSGQAKPRMTDGGATGLVNSAQLIAETQRMRAEAEERRRGAGGRGTQTTYRDKGSGQAVSQDDYAAGRADAKRAARADKNPYDEDQTLAWRGGLAQRQAFVERQREMAELAAKPFAHSQLDTRVDDSLREQLRWGDPMAHLVRNKEKADARAAAPITDRYDGHTLSQSGFKVPQEVPAHSWQRRGVGAPLNRYSIKPGRHWDGVDRSSGFEEERFLHLNTRAANNAEARAWSQADM